MKLSTAACLSMAICLAGCVTPENEGRAINLKWQLEPVNGELATRNVEAGDIIVSWTANARQTHTMAGRANSPALVAASTPHGMVYCSDQICYEDRDMDGAFDHEWQIEKSRQAPNHVVTIGSPEKLTNTIPFRDIDSSVVVFKQQLGLIYTGPIEATPRDGKTLTSVLGELSLGWHGGPGAVRTPDGAGWSEQQRLPFILLEGKEPPRTTISPFGLSYRALSATVGGDLELELQATPVDNIDVKAKPTLNVDGQNRPLQQLLPTG